MQQNKITILSTRSLNDEFIREAESKNILIDVLPFIKTESISSVEIQDKIEKALTMTATIVFTSVNAVEAVVQKLNDKRPNWKIFCISHATKKAVKKYFGENSIVETADNAKELGEEIIHANINEVIFFCGDQRRDELLTLLKKNNIEVKEIVVYQTIATPQKTEKNYDGILFFSPSAAKSFFQKNKPGTKTVLFAIGNTTADEIKDFLPSDKAGSKNKIVISDKPDKKFLLEKVNNYFQTNHIHN